MGSHVAKITSKGQITLPVDLRNLLNLKAGDTVEFVVLRSGEVSVLPCNKAATSIFGRGKHYARHVTEAERGNLIGTAVASRGVPALRTGTT